MKIVLNPELTRQPHMLPYQGEVLPGGGRMIDYQKAKQYVPVPFDAAQGFEKHVKQLQSKAQVNPSAEVVYSDFAPETLDDLNFGFLGLLADCYSRHEKLRIQPQDLWYIVLNELAVEINSQPNLYRELFTDTADKQTIMVQSSTPERLSVEAIVEVLRTRLPGLNVDSLISRLSTQTTGSQTAMAAAVCHMAAPYYNYMTYMCGLPEIEVTGTLSDWLGLESAGIKLATVFESINPRLDRYLTRVCGIFLEIAKQLRRGEPTPSYWKNIFTTKNIGSGSELLISGWITDLYFKKRELAKLENYTSACSVVPFTNLETKREFVAIHGAFGVSRNAEGFLSCEYGQVVFETTGLK